jgi:hypothetical protein
MIGRQRLHPGYQVLVVQMWLHGLAWIGLGLIAMLVALACGFELGALLGPVF